MFVLRRITSDGLEVNTSLGDWYNFVSLERNPEEFKRTTELWSQEDLEGIYAAIVYHEGKDIMPLYMVSKYYIMSENGKTFDNLIFYKGKYSKEPSLDEEQESRHKLEEGNILSSPSSYSLHDCLISLKRGRTKADQDFLDFCINTMLSASS